VILFLAYLSGRPYNNQEETQIMWQVEVDKDKCNGDEECVNACPAQVFAMVDGKSDPVNMDDCLGCETCVEVCPEGAITVTEL